MELSGISSDQRYKAATIVAGILTLIYLLINLFVIGGGQFCLLLKQQYHHSSGDYHYAVRLFPVEIGECRPQ